MMTNMHVTLVRSVTVDADDWQATVEIWPSGRAFERVTEKGVDKHQVWFDARNLGSARHSDTGLKGYARVMLSSVRRHGGMP